MYMVHEHRKGSVGFCRGSRVKCRKSRVKCRGLKNFGDLFIIIIHFLYYLLLIFLMYFSVCCVSKISRVSQFDRSARMLVARFLFFSSPFARCLSLAYRPNKYVR